MSSNITTQLQRELKKHPVKAGVLALLGVVALWFWAPLVIGLLTGEEEDPPTTAQVAAVVSPAVAPANVNANAANPGPESPRVPWSKLVSMMNDDPLKQPLAEMSFSRDPFSAPTTLSAGSADETPGNPNGLPTTNIPGRPLANNTEGNPENGEAGDGNQSTGPSLMGTAIGASKRAAVIDGKPTQEGEFFEANDGQLYFVESVAPRRVVLRLGSQTFVLTQGEVDAAQGNTDGNVVIRRSAS